MASSGEKPRPVGIKLSNRAAPGWPRMLCLNMIVRNEAKIIERCLQSVADHIGCWVIGDTGSTDGTQEIIRAFFAARGIPGELHEFAFENFGQARNEALDRARASPLVWDYVLFTDADMELMVRDAAFRTRLTEPAYSAEQRSSTSYWNNRLLARGSDARYLGVTHEYLSAGGTAPRLHDIWFRDHASGSNRGEKVERDTRLLTEDLARDPDNARSHFYLAQTHRDAGKLDEAIAHYKRRAELGGWAEEVWYAMLQAARCRRKLKDESGFEQEALAAYHARPHRAEPLYDLARFHRQAGRTELALLFCEAGLALPWPEQDVLFIETFVYNTGLAEEYAIGGFYSEMPQRRDKGRDHCDRLALDRGTPRHSRRLARANIRFYATVADDILPSLKMQPVRFAPPPGTQPATASIAHWRDRIWMMEMLRGAGEEPPRMALLALDHTGGVVAASELRWPATLLADIADAPVPVDANLFVWHDMLWVFSNLADASSRWAGALLGRIDGAGSGLCTLADMRVIMRKVLPRPAHGWMPVLDSDALGFLCSIDPTWRVELEAHSIAETIPSCAGDHLRPAAPPMAFDEGWLTLTEEIAPGRARSAPMHRFAWFTQAFALQSLSHPFRFAVAGDAAARGPFGLAPGGDGDLLVSLITPQNEPRLARISGGDVRALLRPLKP